MSFIELQGQIFNPAVIAGIYKAFDDKHEQPRYEIVVMLGSGFKSYFYYTSQVERDMKYDELRLTLCQ